MAETPPGRDDTVMDAKIRLAAIRAEQNEHINGVSTKVIEGDDDVDEDEWDD